MTDNEISSMSPQAINEAVARGLGWIDSDLPVKGRGWIKLEVQPGSWTYLDAYPDYCHSIKAAWEILDSLVSRKRYVSIEFESENNEWDCVLGADRRAYEPDARAQASTTPMAICLAFLKLKKT